MRCLGFGVLSLLPQARCNARIRRRPAGIEGMAGVVEVDDERGMVRWDRLSLPRFAIDFGPDDAVFQRRHHEEVMDAHTDVLMETAGAVTPTTCTARVPVMQSRERNGVRNHFGVGERNWGLTNSYSRPLLIPIDRCGTYRDLIAG